MNAVRVLEERMSVEERLVKVETDIGHIKEDVGGLKVAVHELGRKLDDFSVEVAKEFGAMRTYIDTAKVWMAISGIGTFVAIIGSAVAIVRTMK